MTTFGAYLYIAAVGFVMAGILSSFMQLISGKPPRFNLAPDSFAASCASVMVGLVAGPAILMRNAWRGLRIEARPPYWFGLSLMIAGVWSMVSGLFLLSLLLSV